MAGRKRFSVIRDPVHGDVYLTHEELEILDTPEMQRLRGVKQLGTAYLVFPGAVHTRFDHSIGSLHMASRMIDAANLSFGLDPAACVGIGEEEARVIRIAALVHDVTHIPFGHNIEDQDGIFGRHDSPHRFQRMLGPGTELGGRLRRLGVANDVLAILSGAPAAIPPYWTQVVSGTIACDILDYLARDAYFTGLRLSVDPRVTSYFKVDRASGNLYIDLAKHDLLREDILSEVVRMLEARYYFSERVYYHHAKVAAGALFARAVEIALAAGARGRAGARAPAARPGRRGPTIRAARPCSRSCSAASRSPRSRCGSACARSCGASRCGSSTSARACSRATRTRPCRKSSWRAISPPAAPKPAPTPRRASPTSCASRPAARST
jgi:HD superfamily phosphohydrolase